MTIEDIQKYIKVSKCQKYVYPVDSITGSVTFAPIGYFRKKVEEKYGGSITRFNKEYVTRSTKKYLKEGWTVEQLKEIVKEKGKLPKLDQALVTNPQSSPPDLPIPPTTEPTPWKYPTCPFGPAANVDGSLSPDG